VLQSSRYADGAVLPQPPWLAVGLVRKVPTVFLPNGRPEVPVVSDIPGVQMDGILRPPGDAAGCRVQRQKVHHAVEGSGIGGTDSRACIEAGLGALVVLHPFRITESLTVIDRVVRNPVCAEGNGSPPGRSLRHNLLHVPPEPGLTALMNSEERRVVPL